MWYALSGFLAQDRGRRDPDALGDLTQRESGIQANWSRCTRRNQSAEASKLGQHFDIHLADDGTALGNAPSTHALIQIPDKSGTF